MRATTLSGPVAADPRVRRAGLGIAIVAMLAGALSGCDPSPPSASVMLVRDAEDSLFLVGNVCDATLQKIEIGAGADMDSKAVSTTIMASAGTTGWFQVELSPLTEGYTLEPGSADPAGVPTPFFVRFRAVDGYWGSQAFDRTPAAGDALAMKDATQPGDLQEISVDQVPTTLRMCPEIVRQFTPGAAS